MYLVYEKNYLSNGNVDCVEERDMKLWSSKKEALDDMQSRKGKYIEDEGNNFTFMKHESNEVCFVFADEIQKDGETRSGEFHICLVELQPEDKLENIRAINSTGKLTNKEKEMIYTALNHYGDYLANKLGYSSGEEYWELMQKFKSKSKEKNEENKPQLSKIWG